jgi:hypothetical protein
VEFAKDLLPLKRMKSSISVPNRKQIASLSIELDARHRAVVADALATAKCQQRWQPEVEV